MTTVAPKPRQSQTQRRERAIASIVAAAIELIGEKGTFSVTMAEIGVRAGYSRGLPHQYFGTKEKLIEAILQVLVSEFNERRLRQAAPPKGLASIHAWAETYLLRDTADWKNTKVLLILMAEASLVIAKHREIIRDYNRKNLDFLVKHLQIAKDNKETDSTLDNYALATTLMGTMRGVALQYFVDERTQPATVNTVIQTILTTLL